MAKIAWKASRIEKNSFAVRAPLARNSSWEFWALLTADQHIDNPKTDEKLIEQHLREAKERNAAVMCFGDMMCLMQGKFDKRASKASVRPEHQTDNYLDDVIEWTANILAPYTGNFVMIGEGNHETAITKRHEINPTERLVALMNAKSGRRTYNGKYSGFVKFFFSEPARITTAITLAYHHGAGGAAPVTANMNAMYHNSGYWPDADIIVTGHNHHHWIREISRQRITSHGKIFYDQQYLVKLPTYKHGVGDGSGGFEVEKDMKARPVGGLWVRFFWHRPSQSIRFDFSRAR